MILFILTLIALGIGLCAVNLAEISTTLKNQFKRNEEIGFQEPTILKTGLIEEN